MRARVLNFYFSLPGSSSYRPSYSLQMVARTKMLPTIFSVFFGDAVFALRYSDMILSFSVVMDFVIGFEVVKASVMGEHRVWDVIGGCPH